MPSLSVVMAVYNGEKFLSDAIDSVLLQTHRDFEFLIVNDGSTDGSLCILNEFSRKDSRVKVINQKNKGLPAALNRAVREASGELIARMDADDISLPWRFERQIADMREYGVDLVGSAVYTIDQDGSVDGRRFFPRWHDEIQATLPMRNCISHPSVIFKRGIFFEVGGYDVNFRNSQDYDLWLRLIDKYRFYNSDALLLKYRRHDDRISSKSNKSKQTNYSVCASLNYFNRRYGLDEIIPFAAAEDVICNFDSLLKICVDVYSRDCIIRHATRFARNCVQSKKDRNALKVVALRNANFYQKFKWGFYELLK